MKSKIVAVVVCLFCIGLVNGQPSSPRPLTADGQIDIKRLDRYFDAEPNDDGIGGDMTTHNTTVSVEMITGRTKPEVIAIFVGRNESKDPSNSKANWMPFKDRVIVDLGEGDGERQIFVAAKWKVSDTNYEGSGWGMTVRRSGPIIRITEPAPGFVSQPIIELKGFSTVELDGITYDVFDQAGRKTATDESGFVTDSHFDRKKFEFTTNWFQCYDVELSPGTNTIVLRCSDNAGNTTVTNVVYVFSTAGDSAPPKFTAVDWPTPGMTLSGSSFTARGRIDDFTARLTGEISGLGRTNQISGSPERNGYFWYENVPIEPGEHRLTLTATDAAGNASSTNFVIYGVAGPVLTMDPIAPEDMKKLWESKITVTGKVQPANHEVWVNGVKAIVKPDGTWVARDVPVKSPNRGGTATFEMTAIPIMGPQKAVAQPLGELFVQTSLGTNAMTLNAGSPACGTFRLHMTGTEGRAFILLTSTNLTEWQSILTNLDATATFDYTDTNASACRFFRTVPLW